MLRFRRTLIEFLLGLRERRAYGFVHFRGNFRHFLSHVSDCFLHGLFGSLASALADQILDLRGLLRGAVQLLYSALSIRKLRSESLVHLAGKVVENFLCRISENGLDVPRAVVDHLIGATGDFVLAGREQLIETLARLFESLLRRSAEIGLQCRCASTLSFETLRNRSGGAARFCSG